MEPPGTSSIYLHSLGRNLQTCLVSATLSSEGMRLESLLPIKRDRKLLFESLQLNATRSSYIHPIYMFRRYTIRYNISYWLSSDPSQANDTYCGPQPFTHETWILNPTFSVGTSKECCGAVPFISSLGTTSALPSTPTGKITLANASHGSRIGGGGLDWLTLSTFLLGICLIV